MPQRKKVDIFIHRIMARVVAGWRASRQLRKGQIDPLIRLQIQMIFTIYLFLEI